jgi:hypothetical protein
MVDRRASDANWTPRRVSAPSVSQSMQSPKAAAPWSSGLGRVATGHPRGSKFLGNRRRRRRRRRPWGSGMEGCWDLPTAGSRAQSGPASAAAQARIHISRTNAAMRCSVASPDAAATPAHPTFSPAPSWSTTIWIRKGRLRGGFERGICNRSQMQRERTIRRPPETWRDRVAAKEPGH